MNIRIRITKNIVTTSLFLFSSSLCRSFPPLAEGIMVGGSILFEELRGGAIVLLLLLRFILLLDGGAILGLELCMPGKCCDKFGEECGTDAELTDDTIPPPLLP